jgi:hypothetical protein
VLQILPPSIQKMLGERVPGPITSEATNWDSVRESWGKAIEPTERRVAVAGQSPAKLWAQKKQVIPAKPSNAWSSPSQLRSGLEARFLELLPKKKPLQSKEGRVNRPGRKKKKKQLTELQQQLLKQFLAMPPEQRAPYVDKCLQCGQQDAMMGHPQCKKTGETKLFTSTLCSLPADKIGPIIEVPAWSTEEARVPLVVEGIRILACQDSGQEFSSVHEDVFREAFPGRESARTGEDPDLDELVRRGVMGSDGSSLKLPSGVFQANTMQESSGLRMRVKWFVTAHGPRHWTAGQNLLRELETRGEGAALTTPLQSAAAKTGTSEVSDEERLEQVIEKGSFGESLAQAGQVQTTPFRIDLIGLDRG